jgi:hypothetical protein
MKTLQGRDGSFIPSVMTHRCRPLIAYIRTSKCRSCLAGGLPALNVPRCYVSGDDRQTTFHKLPVKLVTESELVLQGLLQYNCVKEQRVLVSSACPNSLWSEQNADLTTPVVVYCCHAPFLQIVLKSLPQLRSRQFGHQCIPFPLNN